MNRLAGVFAGAALPMLLSACSAGGEPDTSQPASVAPVSTSSALPTNAELAAPPAADGVGCAPQEAPIFACNLANGKRIAVCSPGEFSATYRYGGSTPELTINGGEYAYQMYSGGGEGQLAFSNNGYRYVVFSRMVRTNFTSGEPNDPAISDGVVVLRGDQFVALQLCDDPKGLPLNQSLAGAVFEIQQELFTGETIRADD